MEPRKNKKEPLLCLECDNCSVHYCNRCEINVCEFHVSTHLDSKICNECGYDTCVEMMGTEITGKTFSEELCFRCRILKANIL